MALYNYHYNINRSESTRSSAVFEDLLEFVQPGKIRLAGEIPMSTIRFTNVPGINIF